VQPSTLERALHAWPPWGELILEARVKLNFEPALLKSEEQTDRWEKEVGWDNVLEVGLEALQLMELPWYFGFYWLACFCADYQRRQSPDFSQIKIPPQNAVKAWVQRVTEEFAKDRGIVMVYHKQGAEGKLYPPYPLLLETSFLFALERGEKPPKFEIYGIAEIDWGGEKTRVDGLFEVDRNGSIIGGRKAASILPPPGTYVQIFFGKKRKIPPAFAVEFPMFLATDDVVSGAFKQIQVYREGFRHYISHPLLKYLGEAKVSLGEDILEERRGPKEDVDRFNKGELSFEELIYREWQRELAREGTIAFRLKHKEMSLWEARTAIYHRVRRRLVRRGLLPPRPKRGWRSALIL